MLFQNCFQVALAKLVDYIQKKRGEPGLFPFMKNPAYFCIINHNQSHVNAYSIKFCKCLSRLVSVRFLSFYFEGSKLNTFVAKA